MSQADLDKLLLDRLNRQQVDKFLNQSRAAGQRINEAVHSKTVQDGLRRVNEAGQPIDWEALGEKAQGTVGSALEHAGNADLTKVGEAAGKTAEAAVRRAEEFDLNEALEKARNGVDESVRRSAEAAQHQADIFERERNGEMPDPNRPAPDNNEEEHPDSPSRNGEWEEARIFEQERATEYPSGSRPYETVTWFLDPRKANFVYFPLRAGSQIEPLISSKDVFESVAHAIKNAKKSINIITWGLETDMRLIHSDAEYYRTEKYLNDPSRTRLEESFWGDSYKPDPNIGYYPAAQHPTPPFDYWHTDAGSRPSNPAAAPNEDSWVFADLITNAGLRGVKVNILVWEPSVFAHNYYDPLHFWFRCKTGLIPNVQFAFRKYDGIRCLKPARPNKIKIDGKEVHYRNGSQDVMEAIADRLLNDQFIFNFLYSHHQKEVLIDIEDYESAVGYVIGCNTKEEYWDDSEHKARNSQRRPYRAWRDLGVKVRGPVLWDMYENVLHGWKQMHMSNTSAGKERVSNAEDNADVPKPGGAESEQERGFGLTLGMDALGFHNEVFPAGLIADGLAAGITKGLKVANRGMLNRFNIEKYKFTRQHAVMQVSEPVQWGYRMAPQCIEMCAMLTTLMELIDGLLRGEFDTDTMLSAASPDLLFYNRSAALYKVDDKEKSMPAQFLRTFHMQYSSKDLSIRAAYLRALRSASNNGFIYVENQYFRDPFFAQAIVDLYEKGIKPNILVVTNRLSMPDGDFVMQENIPGEEPTYFVKELLKKANVNINLTWMHVLDCGPESPPIPAYSGPRSMDIVCAALSYMQMLNGITPEALPELYANLLEFRTYLFTQIAPYLLYADEQNGRIPGGRLSERELTMMERVDGRSAPRVAAAVKDFEEIKKSFDPLKKMFKFPEFQELMEVINRTARDVAVDTFDANIGQYKSELETAVDKVLAASSVIKEKVGWEMMKTRLAQRSEWVARSTLPLYGPIRDWFESAPEFSIEEHSRQIIELMAFYEPQRRPLALDPEDKETKKMKRGDIYVHSKAMLIDGVYGIVGSANLNERSMWHDTEMAISFRDTEKNRTVNQMTWDLLKIGLNGKMPEEWDGEVLHEYIADLLESNDEVYNKGDPERNLDIRFLTLDPMSRPWGSFGGS